MRYFILFLLCFLPVQFIMSQNHYDAASQDVNSKLLDAAFEGNFTEIVNCLKMGANVNATDDAGKTALLFVVEKNDIRLVKLLVENGADVNVTPNPDFALPALVIAAKFGYLDISAYLLQKNANVKIKNREGLSAIHFAALYNDTLLLDILLQKGANVMDTTQAGETPLLMAALNGCYQTADRLINAGADIDYADKKGFTSLMAASQNGQVNVVIRLLRSWASINKKNKKGFTALSLAITNGYPEIVDILLLNGADRNEKNAFALNPRSLAHIYHRGLIEDSLKTLGVNNNLLPYFHGFSGGMVLYFNNKDLITGLDIRTMDLKTHIELGIHYLFRTSAIPILQKHADVYYQYWERRHIIGLSVSRKIDLFKKQDIKAGIEPGALYEMNLGNYRGTKINIAENLMLSPQLNFFVQYKQSIWAVSYRYTSYNIEGLSNWFVGLTVHFSFKQTPPVLNKKIIGIN